MTVACGGKGANVYCAVSLCGTAGAWEADEGWFGAGMMAALEGGAFAREPRLRGREWLLSYACEIPAGEDVIGELKAIADRHPHMRVWASAFRSMRAAKEAADGWNRDYKANGASVWDAYKLAAGEAARIRKGGKGNA